MAKKMRRKEKVVKLKEIFAFKWHQCEICESQFRFELAFCMPTGGYDHASYAYSCLPDGRHFIKPLYFCNDHSQDEITNWIPRAPIKEGLIEEKGLPPLCHDRPMPPVKPPLKECEYSGTDEFGNTHSRRINV